MTRPFRGSTSEATRSQLRAKRFVRLRRDVYVLAPAAVTTALAYDALVAALPNAVASHHTAAALLGLPVDADRLIHITRPPGSAVSRQQGIRTHRGLLVAGDVLEVDRRRVTSPTRTFLDLAAVLREVELVILADAVLRRATTAAVTQRLLEAAGVRGVRRATAALALADPGADSPAETRCRLVLHAAGFTELRHGVDVGDGMGGWLARPDLADPRAKVGIQYDGLVHLDNNPERRRSDIDRDELLRQHGWQVVVLTAIDLRQPDRMIAKVAAAYARSRSARAE